jgi:hypothetical protein
MSERKLTPAERKAIKVRQRREAQVGYASNVLGLVAGTAALGSALKDERLASGGKVARSLYSAGKRVPRGPFTRLNAKGPKVAGALAAGAVGLQAANTAGDVVANRVLGRSAVEKNFNEQGISKAYVSPRSQNTGRGINIEKADKMDKKEFMQRNLSNAGLFAGGAGIGAGALTFSRGAKKYQASNNERTAPYLKNELKVNAREKSRVRDMMKNPNTPPSALRGAPVTLSLLEMSRKRLQEKQVANARNTKSLGRLKYGARAAGLAGAGLAAYGTKKQIDLARDIKSRGGVKKADRILKGAGERSASGSLGVVSNEAYNRGTKKYVDRKTAFNALAGATLGGYAGSKRSNKAALISAGAGAAGLGSLGRWLAGQQASDPKFRRKVEARVVDRALRNVKIASDARMKQGVSKAYRRFDPEADRQRRIGLYAGLGGGTALVLGAAGARRLKGSKVVIPKGGKKGLALLAAGAGAGALGAGAYKRGIELRNQPWN